MAHRSSFSKGLARVRFRGFVQSHPFRVAQIQGLGSNPGDPVHIERLTTKLLELCARCPLGSPEEREKFEEQIGKIEDSGVLGDIIAHTFLRDPSIGRKCSIPWTWATDCRSFSRISSRSWREGAHYTPAPKSRRILLDDITISHPGEIIAYGAMQARGLDPACGRFAQPLRRCEVGVKTSRSMPHARVFASATSGW